MSHSRLFRVTEEDEIELKLLKEVYRLRTGDRVLSEVKRHKGSNKAFADHPLNPDDDVIHVLFHDLSATAKQYVNETIWVEVTADTRDTGGHVETVPMNVGSDDGSDEKDLFSDHSRAEAIEWEGNGQTVSDREQKRILTEEDIRGDKNDILDGYL